MMGYSKYQAEDLKSVGVLALLTKPIDMSRLQAIIESV